MKTRLLAIAPTSHPNCCAAADAVLASSSRIVIAGSIPAAATAAATRALRSFTVGSAILVGVTSRPPPGDSTV